MGSAGVQTSPPPVRLSIQDSVPPAALFRIEASGACQISITLTSRLDVSQISRI